MKFENFDGNFKLICRQDRKTALYWAVEKSHVSVVKLLVSAAPDLEIVTKVSDAKMLKYVN